MPELDPHQVIQFMRKVTEYLFRIKKSFQIVMGKISGLDQRIRDLEDKVGKLD